MKKEEILDLNISIQIRLNINSSWCIQHDFITSWINALAYL